MIDYCVLMKGIANAPFDYDKCKRCGGSGLVPYGCCNGYECGCMGLPIEVDECDCGCEVITEEELTRYAGEKK